MPEELFRISVEDPPRSGPMGPRIGDGERRRYTVYADGSVAYRESSFPALHVGGSIGGSTETDSDVFAVEPAVAAAYEERLRTVEPGEHGDVSVSLMRDGEHYGWSGSDVPGEVRETLISLDAERDPVVGGIRALGYRLQDIFR